MNLPLRTVPTFSNQPILRIRDWLLETLDAQQYASCINQEPKRGPRFWLDLAEACDCRLLWPENTAAGIRLTFERLDQTQSFHCTADSSEKYGIYSAYAAIDKFDEPTLMLSLERALKRIALPPQAEILDLGVNDARELEVFRQVYGPEHSSTLSFCGVDHCRTAIEAAKLRFPAPHCRFFAHDINQLEALNLGRFDLLFSIGTLHSPGIEGQKKLMMSLVRQHLKPSGAVILGFPNCRWLDGEATYGAQSRNYNHREYSVLLSDIDFCKRYLQQHRFRVTLTGKYYLLLTATRIGQKRRA